MRGKPGTPKNLEAKRKSGGNSQSKEVQSHQPHVTANLGTAGAWRGRLEGRLGLSPGMWVQLCPPLPLTLLPPVGEQ